MDPRLQIRVQRYGWDRAQPYYEDYWREQLAPAQERLLAMAALRVGESVVDVACGTGLVSFPAAAAVGPAGALVGTDLSQAMVDACAAEAGRRGLGWCRFERMDAEKLTLEDGAFDVALCALGLMYCPDPGRALEEMRRVLRPGGRVAVAVWGARDRCGWAEIFPIVDSRVNSEVCPLFFQLGTGEVLRRSMEDAGLAHVKVERLSTTLRYGSPEDAVGAAFAGGPVALAYSRFDDVTRDEAHDEYLRSIEPYRDGDGYVIPGEFVVASGERGSA